MDLPTLTNNFSIPGILRFSQTEHGLLRASITTPACCAELYLQGAHLTQWQPKSGRPVLFLSERSVFESGKAIRGGVPIIFPWFGNRTPTAWSQRNDGPSHGFARTEEWTLTFAALAGDEVHLTLTLDPSETSRSLGYDHFQLVYQLTLGAELRLRLTVRNLGSEPLWFEDALHTYFAVGDAREIAIHGLAGTRYLDKTDHFKLKVQDEPVLRLSGETDRPYLDTVAAVDLDDPLYRRNIRVEKSNSSTTVIWNPWSTLAARLDDMTAEGWISMVCIETANVATNAITLDPGEQHTTEARISERPHAAPPSC
jgi:glucose-6-phosphate 1-epimerase